MARLCLFLLLLYLTAWIPLNFAVELLATLPTVRFRGAAAGAELAAHGVVAAFSLAGGWALWTGSPDAVRLAAAAVALAAGAAIQSIFWTALPSQTAPGQHVPLAAAHLLLAGLWLACLRQRARASR